MTSLHVLFVDDEQAILDGLRNSLRKERKRWDMTFALGGQQALEEMKKTPADVVITDIDFQGTNEIIHGHFTEITWDGILAESPGDVPPDFGVRSVSLVG